MTRTTRRNGRRLAGLFVYVLALLSSFVAAEAQSTRGRAGTPPDIRPRGKDPTDESENNARTLRQAEKLLAEGNEFLSRGNVQAAKTRFKSVVELVGTQGPGAGAVSALMAMHDEGMQKLESARKRVEEKDFLQALRDARLIKVQYANLFGGIPALVDRPNLARLAAQLIKEIETNPDAQGALQEEKAQPLARRIAKIETSLKKEPWKHYDLFKACTAAHRRYPESPTGQAAGKRLASLRKDKDAWRIIGLERRRRDIASRLHDIEQLEKQGETARAKKALDHLHIKYPDKSLEELRRIAATRTK